MEIYNGNCLDEMKRLADNSVSAIVTDPPYGLSFMNKHWDYDVPSVEIWKEALRVLKPGGHLLSFGGTRTYHRMVVAIEDAGFEIRDQIQWIYGSGFPKSHNIKEGDFKGWGSALKPANEPIVVARKPLDKGLTIAENVLRYGTGALNIDATRIEIESFDPVWSVPESGKQSDSIMVFKEKPGAGSDSMFKNKGGRSGSTQGRWPANVIFDEEAAAMLDKQSGELGISRGGNSKGQQKNVYGKFNEKTDGKDPGFGDSGGASRFFYVAKASNRERNAGLEGMHAKLNDFKRKSSVLSTTLIDGVRQRGNCGQPNQNHHPTVKPIKLMEYLIKLVTPPNGIVLDPFMGSGSTGVAAKNLGVNFIGIEMNEEYFEIAKKRLGTE